MEVSTILEDVEHIVWNVEYGYKTVTHKYSTFAQTYVVLIIIPHLNLLIWKDKTFTFVWLYLRIK